MVNFWMKICINHLYWGFVTLIIVANVPFFKTLNKIYFIAYHNLDS